MNNNENVDVTILDLNGKLVFKSVGLENKVLTLNTKLKPGFYMLKVFSQKQDFLCKVMVE